MLEDLAISFFGNGINSEMNQMYQEDTAQRNEEYSFRNMQFQDKLSRSLTKDTPLLTVAGLRAAGLSPNLINGVGSAQHSGSSAAPQETAPSVDLLGSLSALSQLKQAKASTKLIDEQAEGQKIANDRADVENQILKNRSKAYGTAIRMLEKGESSGAAEVIKGLEDDSTNALGEGNEVDVAAPKLPPLYADAETYKIKSGTFNKQDLSEQLQYEANTTHSKLMKTVEDKQLASRRIINSLANMPASQYDLLRQEVGKALRDNKFFDAVKKYRIDAEKYGAEKVKLDYQQLEYEFKKSKEFDWRNLVSKMMDGGDWSYKDVIKIALAFGAASLTK